MKHIPAEVAVKHQNSPECTVYEYGENGETDAAQAVIRGRYPAKGYALNEISAMTVFVIEGEGIVGTKEATVDVKQGDVIFLKEKEPYFYEAGKLALLLVSSPAWSPDQYREIE